MRRARLPVFALASMLICVSCDTERPIAPADIGPSFQILDGSVDQNHHGFYWLPPMVSQPSFDGTFMGNLPVVVEIFRVEKILDDPADPSGSFHLDWVRPAVLTFGFPGEIEVSTNGQHYQVNWDTDLVEEDDDPNTVAGVYRVAVHLNTKLLGFADVEIVDNGAGFKNLMEGAGDIIGLVDGRTLPIKFRIENEMFDMAFHARGDYPPGVGLDVFVANSKTHAVMNLTNSPDTLDGTPNWHPSGKTIVFASDRANPGQGMDIYTMNPDGTNVQLLATDGWQPEYSPDGSMIAFQRGWPPEPSWGCLPEDEQCGRQHDIWVMNADGANQVQLTDKDHNWSQDPFEDWGPTWHPNGKWVTFARSHNSFTDHEVLFDDCPIDPSGGPPYDPQAVDQADWEDPGCFWHFDIVSVDISDPGHPWIRHSYALAAHLWNYPTDQYPDLLTPRWAPDGIDLAFELREPDGDSYSLMAFVPAATDSDDWFVQYPIARGLAPGSQNPSWSASGEVIFRGEGLGPVGIYYVEDWAAWLADSPGSNMPHRLDFVAIGPPESIGWPRFRPN